jgi:AraC-like DNA-binding protein
MEAETASYTMREILNIPAERDGLCFLHCAGGQGRRVHSHDELEINLVISGTGLYLIDGARQPLSTGSLLWLSPDQAHLLAEESADFIMWVAVIRAQAFLSDEPSRSVRLSPDDSTFFSTLCRKLGEADPELLFNAGLNYLFRQVADLLESAPSGSDMHPSVVRAVRLMKDPEDAADVDAIARHAGMSRSQLSRLFKQQTGFTLVEYRQKMQLERFLFLYGGGQRNLLEAALDAGFGSYPQFYRVFQQRFGCSPREYFKP